MASEGKSTSKYNVFKQIIREPFVIGGLYGMSSICSMFYFFKRSQNLDHCQDAIIDSISSYVPMLNNHKNEAKKINSYGILPLVWYATFRKIIRGTSMSNKMIKNTDLSGKTVLITGGNTGIGYETALQCARWNAKVIITCRDEAKAERTVKRLKKESKNEQVAFIVMELSDLASVKKAVQGVYDKFYVLDCIVLNAGVASQANFQTAQGFEGHFGVNHLGHFLFIYKLLEDLKRWNTRVISVSSMGHVLGLDRNGWMTIDKSRKNPDRNTSYLLEYGVSKAANILFTKQLNNILEKSQSLGRAYVVHPGGVKTDLVRESGRYFITMMMNTICKNAYQGAQTSLYLVAEDQAKLTPGGYYCDTKCVPSSAETEDMVSAEVLWDKSVEMVKEYF